jgi:Uma2 family endonuclease
MPQMLTAPESPSPFPRKRWTRAECATLVAAGMLPEGGFELIEGDIVDKESQNPPHVLVVNLILFILATIFGKEYVQVQAPIALDESNTPEPNIAVTRLPLRAYLAQGTPTASELRLVVEAADATHAGDTTIKALLYARAGIVEYWVVDIAGRALLVYRQPGPLGYADMQSYSNQETIAPLAAPTSIIRVADLLP